MSQLDVGTREKENLEFLLHWLWKASKGGHHTTPSCELVYSTIEQRTVASTSDPMYVIPRNNRQTLAEALELFRSVPWFREGAQRAEFSIIEYIRS